MNYGGTITASYATGSADGGDGGNDYAGGLVGAGEQWAPSPPAMPPVVPMAEMETVTVSAALVGLNGGSGTITASYATGSADGGDGDYDYAGGLVGENSGRYHHRQLCQR